MHAAVPEAAFSTLSGLMWSPRTGMEPMIAFWIWSMVAALMGAGIIRCGEKAPKPVPVRVRARNGR